jgi:hypothetical protein
MLPVACSNEQKIKITSAPVTAAGNPAQLDGGLQAEVVSGDGSFAAVPGEPNSLFVISGTAVGQTRYRVFGDADLGAGQVFIEDTVELEVSGAQAVGFGLTAGTPEPK